MPPGLMVITSSTFGLLPGGVGGAAGWPHPTPPAHRIRKSRDSPVGFAPPGCIPERSRSPEMAGLQVFVAPCGKEDVGTSTPGVVGLLVERIAIRGIPCPPDSRIQKTLDCRVLPSPRIGTVWRTGRRHLQRDRCLSVISQCH